MRVVYSLSRAGGRGYEGRQTGGDNVSSAELVEEDTIKENLAVQETIEFDDMKAVEKVPSLVPNDTKKEDLKRNCSQISIHLYLVC